MCDINNIHNLIMNVCSYNSRVVLRYAVLCFLQKARPLDGLMPHRKACQIHTRKITYCYEINPESDRARDSNSL
jgi:hypothetical protein